MPNLLMKIWPNLLMKIWPHLLMKICIRDRQRELHSGPSEREKTTNKHKKNKNKKNKTHYYYYDYDYYYYYYYYYLSGPVYLQGHSSSACRPPSPVPKPSKRSFGLVLARERPQEGQEGSCLHTCRPIRVSAQLSTTSVSAPGHAGKNQEELTVHLK